MLKFKINVFTWIFLYFYHVAKFTHETFLTCQLSWSMIKIYLNKLLWPSPENIQYWHDDVQRFVLQVTGSQHKNKIEKIAFLGIIIICTRAWLGLFWQFQNFLSYTVVTFQTETKACIFCTEGNHSIIWRTDRKFLRNPNLNEISINWAKRRTPHFKYITMPAYCII